MHKSGTQTYYWSDSFSAVGLRLEGSGNMWFLLPDEGVDFVLDRPLLFAITGVNGQILFVGVVNQPVS